MNPVRSGITLSVNICLKRILINCPKSTILISALRVVRKKVCLTMMHHHYSKLDRNLSFGRRICFFETAETREPLFNTCLWEYSGIYPAGEKSSHGLSYGNDPYTRTTKTVLAKIVELVEHKTPVEVYSEMVKDENNRPRDLKQVNNVREKVMCEKKCEKSKTYRSNLADEILEIIAMAGKHPYVQEVFLNHKINKPPSVVLYTDDQMTDMISFVNANSDHVIGVDRTFNLGACFVTTMVYKNLKDI